MITELPCRDHELVARYYDSVDMGDLEALLALFDESIRYLRPGYAPILGKPRLRRFYAEERTVRHGHHKLLNVVAAGDHIAVEGVFTGVLRDGSEISDLGFADFFVLANGLIAERHTYFAKPAV